MWRNPRRPSRPRRADPVRSTMDPSLKAGTQIPSLDGIRALAVSLVFLAHSGLDRFVPGGMGVTIFFVLSGYLITTLMRIEHTQTRGLSFRAFYLRRLLRLMPPLLIVVGAALLFSTWGWVGGHFTPLGLLSTLLYFGNYYDITHDFEGIPAGLGVLWSLAIEEHYYLLYPPLAALLLGFGRLAWSVSVLSLLCVAILGWRVWLVHHGASEAYLTMATDTRVDAILAGCILALWHNPWLDPVSAPNRARDTCLALVCIGLVLWTLLDRDPVFRLTLRYTVQAAALAPLIYLAVARSRQWPFRWLNSRPLVYLGSVSYTIYLVHHMILLALPRLWPHANEILEAIGSALITLLAAELMRRSVDVPFAKLRRRLHRRWIVAPRPVAPLAALSR